jgi:hypothetical protein
MKSNNFSKYIDGTSVSIEYKTGAVTIALQNLFLSVSSGFFLVITLLLTRLL